MCYVMDCYNRVNMSRLHAFLILLPVLVSMALAGCDKHGANEEGALRPVFETVHVNINVGEVFINKVLNAGEVSLVSSPDFVEVGIDGCSLEIRALSSGDGEIWVSADNKRVRCRITVIDASLPGEPPVPDDDIAAELADISMRVSVGRQVIGYSTPGNMFIISADRKQLDVVSLSTGSEIRFGCDNLLLGDDAVGMDNPVDVSHPVLMVDGVGKPVSEARIMQHTADGVWIRVVTEEGAAIWIVLAHSLLNQ